MGTEVVGAGAIHLPRKSHHEGLHGTRTSYVIYGPLCKIKTQVPLFKMIKNFKMATAA